MLSSMALSDGGDWPMREDPCFQCIVLETVCGGGWYEHFGCSDYKHLTSEQAQRAVKLCEEIVEGKADLQQLCQQSPVWRGKR